MDLISHDIELFRWINNHHCTAADWTMWTASQGWSWAIVLVIFLCFTTMRYEPKKLWLVLLGIGLCFLLSDRISVVGFKNVFQRLRPCHCLEGVRMFRTSCGGSYGFVSSHSANVFALAAFLTLRYRKAVSKFKANKFHSARKAALSPMAFSLLIYGWALLVGYSRPYLGKHFPGDVICGGLLGLAVGCVVFFAIQLIENIYINKKAQKNI